MLMKPNEFALYAPIPMIHISCILVLTKETGWQGLGSSALVPVGYLVTKKYDFVSLKYRNIVVKVMHDLAVN